MADGGTAAVLEQLYQRVSCERQAAEGGPSVPRRTDGAAGRAGGARGKGAGVVLRASNGRVYPRECGPGPLSSPDLLRAILWKCHRPTDERWTNQKL